MAVMFGFKDTFLYLIQRNPYYSLFSHTTEEIILMLGKKSGKSELRIFWGLINPNQRQKFILDRLYVVDTDDAVPMEIDG